jgi:hypothetical protein
LAVSETVMLFAAAKVSLINSRTQAACFNSAETTDETMMSTKVLSGSQ